jgi:hypothetical protein
MGKFNISILQTNNVIEKMDMNRLIQDLKTEIRRLQRLYEAYLCIPVNNETAMPKILDPLNEQIESSTEKLLQFQEQSKTGNEIEDISQFTWNVNSAITEIRSFIKNNLHDRMDSFLLENEMNNSTKTK